MFRHVDLCSGIGGFALGFEWAGLSKPVLFCDIEEWPRKILAKHWPDVPIAEDVKELANDPDRNVPDCDILTAGYPCQPFSLAGERRGAEDDRHIWPDIFSIVQSKRPSWCVFENVYGHVSMGLDEVLSDLEGEGYAARPFIVPACAADAHHRRDRVWIIARNVANADSARQQQGHEEMAGRSSEQSDCGSVQSREAMANAECIERKGSSEGSVLRERDLQAQLGRGSQDTQVRWAVEPAVGRVAHGIPRRVDRLRGLGNAIVPQVAQRIGETIKQIEAKGG